MCMKRHRNTTKRQMVNWLLGRKLLWVMKITFVFDGDNMPDSARYYTKDKAKYSDDVHFSVNSKKNFSVESFIQSCHAKVLFSSI